MKLSRFFAMPILAFVVLVQAHGQNDPMPDPYRNFVGHWSGVVKVNPTNMPPQVDLTITESKDGKKMLWSYIFGTKGQKGYSHASKTFTFRTDKEQMTSEWSDMGEIKHFSTNGLGEFSREGYGKFTAIDIKSLANTMPKLTITIELQQSTLSYKWFTTAGGVTSVSSYFDFQRTPLSNKTIP